MADNGGGGGGGAKTGSLGQVSVGVNQINWQALDSPKELPTKYTVLNWEAAVSRNKSQYLVFALFYLLSGWVGRWEGEPVPRPDQGRAPGLRHRPLLGPSPLVPVHPVLGGVGGHASGRRRHHHLRAQVLPARSQAVVAEGTRLRGLRQELQGHGRKRNRWPQRCEDACFPFGYFSER